ncbi:hypothetical protein [Lysinibacillus sphaericus]|nr:hypothetical protein [Lysinibacillus sphaericus]
MMKRSMIFVKSLEQHGVFIGVTDEDEYVVLCDGKFYTVHKSDVA